MRPTVFNNLYYVEKFCKSGLADEKKLGLENETNYTTTLTHWIKNIQHRCVEGGMDTVFYPYDPDMTTVECSLFDDWGTLTQEQLDTWVEDLQVNGVKQPTTASSARTLPNELQAPQVVEKLQKKYLNLRGNKQWPHANAKQQKDQVATLSSKLNTLSQCLDSIDKNTNPRGGGMSGK